MVAYAIWLFAILHLLDAWWSGARAFISAAVLGLLVTAQATLGIVTLLNVAPLGLSLVHQALAIVVLTAAVLHAESLRAGVRAGTVSREYPLEHGAKAT
jgi:cytochrome c oxidase assembly protein subunit 15